MNLFQRGKWTMHSGAQSNFKLECDALTADDIKCLAFLISERLVIREVRGVPTGGERLADALQQYVTVDGFSLIVDSVLTTGSSMEDMKKRLGWEDAIGVVIFSRDIIVPNWIHPMITTNPEFMC